MVLTDEQRVALKSALDAVRPGTGRPLADERRTVEGVVWRLRNGARWRALPAEFGPWWRAAQLHIRWSAAGLWGGVLPPPRGAGRARPGGRALGAAPRPPARRGPARAGRRAHGRHGDPRAPQGGGRARGQARARPRPVARRLLDRGLRGVRRRGPAARLRAAAGPGGRAEG